MKPTILKLSAIFLLFAVLSAGCQKDEDLFELQIGDENAVIQKEIDGIEFKFCLLNEAGEPATIFNEGENFTFQLSIKNNTDTTLYYDNSVLNVDGFCEVKDDSRSFGSPYKKPVAIELIGKAAFGIPIGHSAEKSIKWIPNNDIWTIGYVSFMKDNDSSLSKGTYYTEFTHKFDFDTIQTDKLSFKINFEIK